MHKQCGTRAELARNSRKSVHELKKLLSVLLTRARVAFGGRTRAELIKTRGVKSLGVDLRRG